MFSFTSIKDYHNALTNNLTTCTEAVNHYLKEIASQSDLNAFVEVFSKEALERADHLDKQFASGGLQGKLHGIVIGIKDVLCYKDHKASASSKILKDFTSIYNATAVQRLLDEGAIVIGRQNCDEFAMGSSNENSTYGPVLNATDKTRVPGGSSGGSAVAVQAGLCMISLGSDTGGSVRQPADFCGIIGMKPSYGRISRYGLIAYASSFDQIGIFGNNIEDIAITLECIAGPDEFDSTVNNEPIPSFSKSPDEYLDQNSFCYFRQSIENPGLDKEIKEQFLLFVNRLKEKGCKVDVVDFDLINYVVPTYYILTTAEASSNLSRYDGVKYGFRQEGDIEDLDVFYKQNRSLGFGKEVKRRIMLGTFVLSAGYYDAYFSKAQQVRYLLREKTKQIFTNYDAILSPTVPSPAYKIGEKMNDPIAMFLGDIYTVFANLTGIPGISIPVFKHSNGMPFGLQIMTDFMQEPKLLGLSKSLMKFSSLNQIRQLSDLGL